MLLSMLRIFAEVEPSETLVLLDCCEAAGVLVLPLAAARVAPSPAELGGKGLLGLSIFTVILSIWRR